MKREQDKIYDVISPKRDTKGLCYRENCDKKTIETETV